MGELWIQTRQSNWMDIQTIDIQSIQSIRSFPPTSQQGFVELAMLKYKSGNLSDEKSRNESRSDLVKEIQVIIKISKHVDFTIEHEYFIAQSLKSMSLFCPYFCQSYGYKRSDQMNRPEYKIEHLDPEKKNSLCLFIESIPTTLSLGSAILDQKISSIQIVSVLKQVSLALYMGQLELDFTHYDLHTDNILLVSLSAKSKLVYTIQNQSYFVSSQGVLPVLIDYGYSYCKELKGHSISSSFKNIDKGFHPMQPDLFNDLKIWWTNMLMDIQNSKLFYHSLGPWVEYTTKLFPKLKFDQETGWDKIHCTTLSTLCRFVYKRLVRPLSEQAHEKPTPDSLYFFMDQITALIPVSETEDIDEKYKSKLELELLKDPLLLFIRTWYKYKWGSVQEDFKQMIGWIRMYKQDYTNHHSISSFHDHCQLIQPSITRYDTEKLFVSLWSLSIRLKRCLQPSFNAWKEYKRKELQILSHQGIKSMLDIYLVLNKLYPDPIQSLVAGETIYIMNQDKKMFQSWIITQDDIDSLPQPIQLHDLLSRHQSNHLE